LFTIVRFNSNGERLQASHHGDSNENTLTFGMPFFLDCRGKYEQDTYVGEELHSFPVL